MSELLFSTLALCSCSSEQITSTSTKLTLASRATSAHLSRVTVSGLTESPTTERPMLIAGDFPIFATSLLSFYPAAQWVFSILWCKPAQLLDSVPALFRR
jgi:hypothetical protein